MKKFKFRLQKVLEHKERLFEIAKEEYAVEQRKLSELHENLDLLSKKFQECLQEAGMHTKGTFNIKDLALFYRYQFFLKREILAQKHAIELQEEMVSGKREVLVQASKEKEVLIKLKKKQYAQYTYEADCEEQKMMDDIFSAKHARKTHAQVAV